MRLYKDFCKVQYGCGLSNPVGWENYDSTPTLFIRKIPFAKFISKIVYGLIKNNYPRIALNLRNVIFNNARYGDITKKLPKKNNSVDYLYCSHVLEHLPLKEFRKSINESYRILKPGGVFRLVVTNLKYYINQYQNSKSKTKSIDFCLNSNLGKDSHENFFSRLRGDSHHIMFDYETLENELKKFNFLNCKAKYQDSHIKFFVKLRIMNVGFIQRTLDLSA